MRRMSAAIAVHVPGGPPPPDRALVLALLRRQTGPRKAVAQSQNAVPPQRTVSPHFLLS